MIPSHGRPEYLSVALASLMPQAERAQAPRWSWSMTGRTRGPRASPGGMAPSLSRWFRARGLNAARNAGIAAAAGELIVFVDDDCRAPPGWLEALLAGIAAAPDRDVFGGPDPGAARGRRTPRVRSRGAADHDARQRPGGPRRPSSCGARTWRSGAARSSGSAVRRDDPRPRRRGGMGAPLRHAGGRIRYVAGAWLEHRRTPPTRPSGALSRAAYAPGKDRASQRRAHGPRTGASLASCACSSAASGTRSGAAARTAS